MAAIAEKDFQEQRSAAIIPPRLADGTEVIDEKSELEEDPETNPGSRAVDTGRTGLRRITERGESTLPAASSKPAVAHEPGTTSELQTVGSAKAQRGTEPLS